MLRHLFTFLLAGSLALYLTPLARQAAIKFGLTSKPDGDLRDQTEAVPYLGGVAVYLGFLLALVFVFDFEKQVLGLLLGGTIMLLVGLIDDLGVMTPGMKLFGEAVAVLALLKAGIVIELVFIPSWDLFKLVPVPVLSYVLSAFWLLAVANAFNFLDVEDGLAAGVAFFASLALFAVALINRHEVMAAVAIALAGSLLGFLRSNFRPARIYLGDSGSLFLGLLLGALAMIGRYTDKNSVAALAPVIILGVAGFPVPLAAFPHSVEAGLLDQVPGKQHAGLYPPLFEVFDNLIAGKARAFPHGEQEAKPGRVGVCRGLWQYKAILQTA